MENKKEMSEEYKWMEWANYVDHENAGDDVSLAMIHWLLLCQRYTRF